MARVIVLDAGVLIAFFDPDDSHHAAALGVLLEAADDDLVITPINQAEVLVRPAHTGRLEQMAADVRALGVAPMPLPDDAGARLATLRVRTRLKMPDCCVLLTAEQAGATVATFDEGLREAARELGMEVLPQE